MHEAEVLCGQFSYFISSVKSTRIDQSNILFPAQLLSTCSNGIICIFSEKFRPMIKPFFALTVLMTGTLAAWSQQMDFEAYDPPSTLVVPEHLVSRAKYPFID